MIVMHQMRTLTEAIWYMGCVDQLDLPSLLEVEALCRRVAAVAGARAQAERPAGRYAPLFAGTAATEEIISPSLQNHVLPRAKEDVDLQTGAARASSQHSGGALPG